MNLGEALVTRTSYGADDDGDDDGDDEWDGDDDNVDAKEADCRKQRSLSQW